MNTLLQIVVVHHPANEFGVDAARAVRRAFGNDLEDTSSAGIFASESIWSSVRVTSITNQQDLNSLQISENDRVVWILLVDYPMTEGQEWPQITTAIGARIASAAVIPNQKRLEILFWGEPGVVSRLPDTLKDYQVRAQQQLGEHRMGPHRLALLTLHRARLLLGRNPEKNALRFFISHAKADGVFFADALKGAIKQVPELDTWYDAEDIATGAKWKKELKDNASNSVLIAIRTESYTQRAACLDEFQWALEHGVPIVVVDALIRPDVTPASLPFAAMPTVRIPDGNTNRVLVAALREHVRILLVETQVAEQSAITAPNLPATAWRIWPRLPTFRPLQEMLIQQKGTSPSCIVIADASGPEINAAAGMLQSLRTANGAAIPITITTADYFASYAVTLAAAFPPVVPNAS